MHLKDLYPIIVTDQHAVCRDFYVRWFGFKVVFEATWFVYGALWMFSVLMIIVGCSLAFGRPRWLATA